MSIFAENEIAILSDKAVKGLPQRVGERCKIVGKTLFINFDYDFEFDDGVIHPVNEDELIKLTEDDKQKMGYLFTNNKVLYWYDEVTIMKVDYLHKKAEIKFDDESCLVVEFENLHPLEIKEIDSVDDNSRSNKHRQIIEEIHNTFKIKNADYGNSFGEQFNEYGLLSAVIRLDDKMRRLKQLMKQDAQVKDESIRDTVLDMANYAIMTVMELDNK